MIRTAVVLFLLLPVAAMPQTLRSSLLGVVNDESGQPVAAAAIRVTHIETGQSRTSASDGRGGFSFALLAPGAWSVEVLHPSHAPYRRTVEFLVGQEVHLDVTLPAARRGESVTVTASRALLKFETPSLGAVIDNHQIRGLPLDGRNFLELSLLVPGTVPAAPGSAASTRGDLALSVNGSREDANNFLLDGVYNGDPKLNSFGVNAAVDAIREFEVVTSTYDASFGRNAGGQINVVLKSGTNQVHGTLYHFFRNAALDARNFFSPADTADPRYQRNQFGFSLGGPLRRNKTFLFGDFEGRRGREADVRLTNVPTALERAGDFSRSSRTVFDPRSRQPMPGNRLPAFFLHPAGVKIAAIYPLPNREAEGRNFVSAPIERDRNEQFDLRLDHHMAAASDLSLRYSFAGRSFFEPFSGPTFAQVPGFGTDVPRRAQNAMAAHTHAFTPMLLNELRAGFSRVTGATMQQNRDRNLNREVGLPTLPNGPRAQGLSFITVPGFSPLGDEYNNPQQSTTNTYQVLDHFSWSSNRHQFKAGAEFRRLQQNAFRDVQARGFLNFLGITGVPLADLLLGTPAVTGGAVLDNPQYLRSSSYNFFLNHQWRISPYFSVTTGLRYEFNSPPVDRFDRANLYDPAQGRLVAAGKQGFPRAGYEADKNNWGPRVGIAILPTCSERTILRAGYGIYYDQSALAPGEGLYFSPPYYDFRLYFTSEFFPLSLSDPFPAAFPFPVPNSALSFQRDMKTATMHHWNFTVQQQLGAARMFEAGYVGSKGTHLLAARDINQPLPTPAERYLRPNPLFEDINSIESRGNSSYHALQARLQQRLDGGVSLLAGYAWSKSIDDSSSFFSSNGDPNFPQDSYNAAAERGRSNFDLRHRFTASYSWELPFGNGKRFLQNGIPARLFGGWQSFGIWTFQTGRPFTVALLADMDNSNTGRSILGFGANDRPDLLRDPALRQRAPERWFDTTAFAMPRRGSFGNAGRNVLDGPGLAVINASLLRDFRLAEALRIQFRAEAFNLLNRPNFDLPDNFLGSASFGSVRSAGPPRHIQFGIKLLF